MNTELEWKYEDDFEGEYNCRTNACLCSTRVFWCSLCARYHLNAEDINCTEKIKLILSWNFCSSGGGQCEGTDSKQPCAMSGGWCNKKSTSKEKALRVIKRKNKSEQCRWENGDIKVEGVTSANVLRPGVLGTCREQIFMGRLWYTILELLE